MLARIEDTLTRDGSTLPPDENLRRSAELLELCRDADIVLELEVAGRPAREAVAEAVRHVAPAIAAAGLVLAASFATLMLASGEASKSWGSRWPSGSSWPR